jgi:hypothetical protein
MFMGALTAAIRGTLPDASHIRGTLPDASHIRGTLPDASQSTYWYLASPYSKHPLGIEEAFREACRATADLIRAGVRVYSPIAHTHPVAVHGGIDPYAHDIWLPADEPFMNAASGLIVLRAESWEISYGIGEEIKAFKAAGKQIVFMDPGIVPPEALP